VDLLALEQRADQQLPGYSGKLMMDVEIIAALCPAVSISVYFARLQSVAMLGVTVCAASGDGAAGDQMNDGRAHVNFPPAACSCSAWAEPC
jgi:hypothetical protein